MPRPGRNVRCDIVNQVRKSRLGTTYVVFISSLTSSSALIDSSVRLLYCATDRIAENPTFSARHRRAAITKTGLVERDVWAVCECTEWCHLSSRSRCPAAVRFRLQDGGGELPNVEDDSPEKMMGLWAEPWVEE